MATPSEITALIEQAWNLDPEEHFFEFLYDLTQTNATLFALGYITHDELKAALDQYIAAGGKLDGEEAVQSEPSTDQGSA